MVGFVVRNFRGMQPRTAPRLIADNQAQDAVNTVLTSGFLVALKENAIVTSGVDALRINTTSDTKTIYKFDRTYQGDDGVWFSWPTDVNVTKGALANDENERTYFTGDGVPKLTTNKLAMQGTSYPAISYILGIKAPTTAPNVLNVPDPLRVSHTYEQRQYVMTYKTATDESKPTISSLVDAGTGNSVVVSSIPVPPVATATVLVSTDGQTWTRSDYNPTDTANWVSEATNDSGVRIVTIPSASYVLKYTGYGEPVKISIPVSPKGTLTYKVVYGNGVFVLFPIDIPSYLNPDDPSYSSFVSVDGELWNDGVIPKIYAHADVVGAPSIYKLVATKSGSDAVDFPKRRLSSAVKYTDVVFGNGVFIAIRDGGTNFIKSTNGIVWDIVPTRISVASVTTKTTRRKANTTTTETVFPTMQSTSWTSIVFTGSFFVVVARDTSNYSSSQNNVINPPAHAYLYSATGATWAVEFIPPMYPSLWIQGVRGLKVIPTSIVQVKASNVTTTSSSTTTVAQPTVSAIGIMSIGNTGNTVVTTTTTNTTVAASNTIIVAIAEFLDFGASGAVSRNINAAADLPVYGKLEALITISLNLGAAGVATYPEFDSSNDIGFLYGAFPACEYRSTYDSIFGSYAVKPSIVSKNTVHSFATHGITSSFPVLSPGNSLTATSTAVNFHTHADTKTYYSAPLPTVRGGSIDTWITRTLNITSGSALSGYAIENISTIDGAIYATTSISTPTIVSKELYRKVGDGDYLLVKSFTGSSLQDTTYTDAALTSSLSVALDETKLVDTIKTPQGFLALTSDAVVHDGALISETRVYVVTFVSELGEESAPSPASDFVTVYGADTVNLSNIPTPEVISVNNARSVPVVSKKIHRSISSAGAASYAYVDTIDAAATTYSDKVLSESLGETITSIGYDTPPANMQGLVAMPNGFMAGFSGNDVYFSVPYKPYAWPATYAQTTDYPIVGLGTFDTTLLVLTTGVPYLISGSDPSNMSMVASNIQQACVSKRSIVNTTGGVVFASPDGLISVGGSGVDNITKGIFTRIEWQRLNPSSISGYLVDNKYIGFYKVGSTGAGFILDLQTLEFSKLDWYASAGTYDSQTDALFLVVGSNLVKFSAGANDLVITWKSKEFYYPKPISMGVAQVDASAYPLTLNVYADKQLKYTHEVLNSEYFRIPSGYMAKSWELEVMGAATIYSLGIAQSTKELQGG